MGNPCCFRTSSIVKSSNACVNAGLALSFVDFILIPLFWTIRAYILLFCGLVLANRASIADFNFVIINGLVIADWTVCADSNA